MIAKKCWIGFDLGGTKMLAAVYDSTFKELGRKRRPTEPADGRSAGLDRISDTISKAIEKAGLKPSDIAAIGIGSPGPLDHQTGTILNSPNLAWGKVPLAKRIQADFSCPVSVINDVDAGLYGEYTFGAARNAACAIGVFPGTGIGGACVYRGSIIMGERNSCMEIGHLPVLPDGPLCGCGQRGCLEAVGSRLAIAAACAQAAYRGNAPTLRAECGTDISLIRSGAIARAIAAGDKAVQTIVEQAAHWLGIGVASIVNIMAPDTIVLGGGLVEALPDLYLQHVNAAANSRVMKTYSRKFKIVTAKLGDDSAIMGAAAYVCGLFDKKLDN